MSDVPFKLVVRAVIKNQDGKILILKRSRDSRSNPCCWELPGGKVEPGEDFEDALIREIKEETDLNIFLKKTAGIAQQDLPYSRSVHVIMDVEVISGNLKISDEHEEYKWAFLDEIKKLQLSEWFSDLLKEKDI